MAEGPWIPDKGVLCFGSWIRLRSRCIETSDQYLLEEPPIDSVVLCSVSQVTMTYSLNTGTFVETLFVVHVTLPCLVP